MDDKRFLKALGAGGVAVLMISGVAIGADAILRTPGAQAPAVLAADETVSQAEPSETVASGPTVEPSDEAQPIDAAPPTQAKEAAKPARAAKVESHRTEHPKSTTARSKSGHDAETNDDSNDDHGAPEPDDSSDGGGD